jgi:hypothetical protein
MIVFGGGHDDYFGSDVHAFDLERREWRRLSTGFIAGQTGDYGEGAIYPDTVYPDGSPLPPHTYDYVQYDAVRNDFILLKGQTELGPNVKAAPVPHLFNLDALAWRHGPRHESAILNSGGFTTWDAGRRLLWGHSGDDGGGNAFVAYCPDGGNPDGTTGSWTEFHPSKLPGEANHNAMQIHPDTDSILVTLHARDSLAVIDPKRPGDAIALCVSHGCKPRIHEYAALEYAARTGSLVYYSAARRVGGRSAHQPAWIRLPMPPRSLDTTSTWRIRLGDFGSLISTVRTWPYWSATWIRRCMPCFCRRNVGRDRCAWATTTVIFLDWHQD